MRDTLPDLSDPSLVDAWFNKETDTVSYKGISSNDLIEHNGVAPINIKEDVGRRLSQCDYDNTGIPGIDGTSTITILCWVKVMDFGTGNNVFFRLGGAGIARINSGNQQLRCVLGDIAISGSALDQDRWYMITVVKNGVNVKFYLDDNIDIDENTNGTESFSNGLTINEESSNQLIHIKNVEYYSEAKSHDWVKEKFKQAVSDRSLILDIEGGVEDTTRFEHEITNDTANVGKYMEFDGASQISIPSDDVFDSTKLTVMFYIKFDFTESGATIIIARHDANVSLQGFHFFITNSGVVKLQCKGASGNSIAASTLVNSKDGMWHHIAATLDTSNGAVNKIYRDGVLTEETTSLIAWGYNSQPITIGKSPDSFWKLFVGSIADVKIYNEHKSDGWIKEYYQRTRRNYTN